MTKKLTVKQIERELSPDYNQVVYFDPATEGLFTLKRTEGNRVIIGGGCGYYSSAITGLMRYIVCEEYFKTFKPITRESPLLEADKSLSVGTHLAQKIKGWDCVRDDYIFHNIYDSSNIKVLDGETNTLVRANVKKWGLGGLS